MQKKVRRALTVFLALIALFSGVVIAWNWIRSYQEKQTYSSLASQVRDIAQLQSIGDSDVEDNEEADGYSRLNAYIQLADENPDMAGWITIPGTGVDYPVMYTPEEPEYYLRRNFYGEYAVCGSIFVGEGCAPDGIHTILYGHNMDDGSMFATLLDYQEEEFAKEHATILYDTLEEEGEYQVVGAFYSEAYASDEKDVFRYYRYTDLSDPEVYEEYVHQVKEISLYDTGVTPQPGDKLVTLSTCSYHTADGRFVVVAYKPKESF